MKHLLLTACLVVACFSLVACNSSRKTNNLNLTSKTTSDVNDISSLVQSSGKSNSETYMPKQEPGMNYIYNGSKKLIKITNDDNSLYYFPSESGTPEKYRGSTWFIIDPSVNPSQKGIEFNIDSDDGIKKAQEWIKKYVSTDKQDKIINSLQTQRGTKCLIYYEVHIS